MWTKITGVHTELVSILNINFQVYILTGHHHHHHHHHRHHRHLSLRHHFQPAVSDPYEKENNYFRTLVGLILHEEKLIIPHTLLLSVLNIAQLTHYHHCWC